MTTSALVTILFLAGAVSPAEPAPLRQERTLASGAVVSGEIRGGSSHEYRVEARAGDAIDVRVTQLGIDLVLVVQDATGATIVEVDSPNGPQGDEPASIVAERTGVYRVRVTPLDPNVGPGRYEVRAQVRAATPRDIELAAVQTAFTAARRRLATGAERDAAVRELHAAVTKARALGEADFVLRMTASIGEIDPKALFEVLGVQSLPGAVPVYASRGFESRASALRDRLARAVDHFDARLKVRPPVALAVLARDDWQAASGMPYGMPFSSPGRLPLVVMPAEHAMFHEFAAAMKQQGVPSGEMAQRIARTGLSLEDGLSLAADDIMYHELGHVLAGRYGIAQPNRWFAEFLANYFAQAYLAETVRDPRAVVFSDVLRAWTTSQSPTYTSLDDFERLYGGVGPANYGWYQGQFEARAVEVHKAQGLDFLARVKTAFPEGTPQSLPVPDVLARLEAIAPGFQAWARALTERKPR